MSTVSAEPMVAAALLVLALLPLAAMLLRRRQSPPGRRRFGPLVLRSWQRFGLTTAILLGIAGRWPALWWFPVEFTRAQALIGVADLRPDDRLLLTGAGAIGVMIGMSGGALLTAWRAWRGRPEGTLLGDAGAVRPGPGEIGWGAALSVTAGITEEAYFRLLLPLLATLAFGSAVAGFVGAAVLFGLAHRYQGWRGIVATTFAGAAMSGFYLATEHLIATMVFHAAGDLGHLAIRPALRGWIERRRALTSRG